MSLPNSGTCSYNGVAFTQLYKSKMTLVPVKDSAGRALVTRKYDLDVEGYVAAPPGSTTDNTLATYRRLLAAPAGQLLYFSKGYGPLQVNVPGGQLWDAAYGPWPELLEFTPVGSDQSAFVHWRCSTELACEENPAPVGIIEWCWSEDWSIDNGLTTRVISGHVIVQATRRSPSNRSIPANADDYREQVTPEVPLGFRRKENFKLSEDKRRLDFTFTDEELPFPLPVGVSAADVRQKIDWKWRENAAILRGSISGTFTVPARAAKSQLMSKILLLVNSRVSKQRTIDASRLTPNAIDLDKWTSKGKDLAMCIIDGFSLDDDVFGLSTGFNVTYSMFGVGLSVLLPASGMWEAIPGTDFQQWRTSMLASAFNPRGAAGMRFENNSDAIIDLCARQSPRTLKGGVNPRNIRGMLQTQTKEQTVVPPERSWIWYRASIRLIEDDRVIRHKPLQQKKPPQPVPPLEGSIIKVSPGFKPWDANELGGPLSQIAKDKGDPEPGVTSSTPDLLQRVSAPSYTIILEGKGVRAGYTVPIPRLDSVGGVPATQVNSDIEQRLLTMLGSIPIYQSVWRITYILPDDPQGALPVPANPALSTS